MNEKITANDIYHYIVGRLYLGNNDNCKLINQLIDILNLCDEENNERLFSKQKILDNTRFVSKPKFTDSFPSIVSVSVHLRDEDILIFFEIFFSSELLLSMYIIQNESVSVNVSWMRIVNNSVSILESFISDEEFNTLDDKIKLFLIKNIDILTKRI